MDPVTAVGLASGILTFVQAGLKLVGVANQIYSSVDGVLDENKHRESIAEVVKQAAIRLEVASAENSTSQQMSLCNLARKCQTTSTELINVLDDVKPVPSSTSLFRAWKGAIKATRKEETIKCLERRLEAYRNQLTLELVELSKSEAENSFANILSRVKKDESTLNSLTESLRILREGQLIVDAATINTQDYSYLRQLLTVDEEIRSKVAQELILKSLEFEVIHNRYEAIHETDKDSFKWIYGEIGISAANRRHDGILETQQIARERFLGWLSTNVVPSPIFYIKGKLGSGKSTLMKFLYSHPRTRNKLESWAGEKKLLFTSFFFWRNGEILQKSLRGLYYSILHDVLASRRDLIPEALPEHWELARQAPWQIEHKLDIRGSLVKDALNRLLDDPRLYENRRLCFFIDGLDEFEPGSHDGLDYLDLLNILRHWANHANGNLKLCVSSREEPVFMNTFATDPSFRLQDLTRFDMQEYARHRLDSIQDARTKERIIDQIPEISSGIFLWTYLVVQTIRNKLSHGISDASLESYLNSLPRGLEALFAHVLDNLDPEDERRTLRTIDVLKVAKRNELSLSLFAFSLWDNYEKDTEFSIRDNIRRPRDDLGSLEMQLRGSCGGLIESQPGLGKLKALDYVHRSVPDMFYEKAQTPELGRRMKHALSGFDPVNAFSHLSFGSARLSSWKKGAKARAASIALMRLREKNDQPPCQFLDYLDSWVSNSWFENPVPNNAVLVKGADSLENFLIGPKSHGDVPHEVLSSTICLAAFVGQRDYVNWHLANDPTIANNHIKKALIAQMILRSKSWECFFGSEVLNQPFASNLIPIFHGGQMKPTSVDSDALTPWQFFVGQLIWRLERETGTEEHGQAGEVMQRFLEQGEDPFCQVRVEIDRQTGASVVASFRGVTIRYGFPFSSDPSDRRISRMLPEIIIEWQNAREQPGFDWKQVGVEQQFNVTFSLRELIKKVKWENRDRILELLDQNLKKSSGRGTSSSRIYITGKS